MLLDISAQYLWAMGVLPGDVHPSELERLDKPCARARIELATIRLSVDNSDHSVNSSPKDSALPKFSAFTLYSSININLMW